MRTNLKWADLVSLLMMAAMVGVTGMLYSRLPDQYPIHWGLDGHVNGTMSKPFGPWISLIIAFVSWIIVRFSAPIFPGAWRERLKASPLAIMAFTLTLLFCSAQMIALYQALHPDVSTNTPFCIVTGIFFILHGQLCPRIRRNPLVGYRTAFTLSSDENWARTHRVAGMTFTLMGLLIIFIGMAWPWVNFIVLLVGIFIPYLYSFLLAHKLSKTNQSL